MRLRARARHDVAVPEEEEEDEQSEGQAADDSEGPEHELAAAGQQELHDPLRPLDHPRLDLLSGDGKPGLDPFHRAADHGQLEQILRPGDLVLAGRLGQTVAELDGLPRKRRRAEHDRNGDPQRHGDRQNRGGDGLAAAEKAPQPAVDGKEHEGEQERPVDRPEERLEDPEEQEGEERHHGQREDPGREPVRCRHGVPPARMLAQVARGPPASIPGVTADGAPDRLLAARILREEAEREGFTRFGVARAERAPRFDRYERWIAAGLHAGMRYLEDTLEERRDPRRGSLRGAVGRLPGGAPRPRGLGRSGRRACTPATRAAPTTTARCGSAPPGSSRGRARGSREPGRRECASIRPRSRNGPSRRRPGWAGSGRTAA